MKSHRKPQTAIVWLIVVMGCAFGISIGREFDLFSGILYRTLQVVCFVVLAYTILPLVAAHESFQGYRHIAWLVVAVGGIVLFLSATTSTEIQFPIRLARRIGGVALFFAPFFMLLLYTRTYDRMKSQLEDQVRDRTQELSDANERLRSEMFEKLRVSNQLELVKTDLDGTVEVKRGELEEVGHQILRRERLEALSQVSAGISHELNNKLSPIVWYGTILTEDSTLTGRQRFRVQCMAVAAQNAIRVVRNLQQFDHRGGVGSAFAPTSPRAVISSAAESTRLLIGNVDEPSPQELRIESRVDSKKMVLADVQQLRHLLCNLLSNAVDSLRNQNQEKQCIRISSRDEAGWVVFEVADNGPGMSEEESSRCFEPFFTTKANKNGLGLSACYGIAKRHGGRVESVPNPNGGMTFRVYIPSVDEEAPASDDPATHRDQDGAMQWGSSEAVTATSAPASARLAKVLFVDDNATVRTAITDLLTTLGADVVAVESGSLALQLLKDDDSIDVVITDLLMEGMSGIELLAACREMCDVPFVLISGWPRRRIVEMLAGTPQPDEILSKPCRVADLEQVLKRFAPESGDHAEPTQIEQSSYSV